MPLRCIFLMDPIDRIDIRGDSTFVLMLEAQKRGHTVYYAEPRALEQLQDRPFVTAQPAEVRRQPGAHFTLGPAALLGLDDADVVFMRKDPPFDMEYLVSTLVLERVDRRRVVMVNDPQALRDCNEKLFALHFPSLVPKTLVARAPARLRAFIDEVGDVVVKPLNGAGGSGVVRLVRGDKNTGAILDLLTDFGRVAICAQAYLPKVTEGDRRIVLVAGEPAGVINRRPRVDDLRSNMHVGGTAEAAKLTPRDLEICRAVGPELLRRGLIFVGIDVIDGWLTEINVTSPTGIQEIDRFDGVSIEGRIFDWIEARRAALGAPGTPG